MIGYFIASEQVEGDHGDSKQRNIGDKDGAGMTGCKEDTGENNGGNQGDHFDVFKVKL